MPAFPGAQYSLVTSGDAEIDQHSACSRPPPPTTSTFMDNSSPLYFQFAADSVFPLERSVPFSIVCESI
jgi:hypothetical protein